MAVSSSSTRIATPGAPAVNPLTAANLSEQNRRISSSRVPATTAVPATEAQQTDEPEQLADQVAAVQLDDADTPTVGDEEQTSKGVALKKRKYSADLFEYTKGMWAVIREDIE